MKSLIKDKNNELYTFKNHRWDQMGDANSVTLEDFEAGGMDNVSVVVKKTDGRTVRLEHQQDLGDKKEFVAPIVLSDFGRIYGYRAYASKSLPGGTEVIYSFQYGDYLGTAEFGTLFLVRRERDYPTKPWIAYRGGNIYAFNNDTRVGLNIGINSNINNIGITNTSSDPAKVMKWLKFKKKHDLTGGLGIGEDKNNPADLIGKAGDYIYILDRTVVMGITWQDLNSGGWIFGKEVEIDGVKYVCRAVTGGNNGENGPASPITNEWDALMVEAHNKGVPIWTGGTPEVGNYDGGAAWCQETWYNNSAQCVFRGGSSPASVAAAAPSDRYTDGGWRPALIPIL